MLKTRENLLTDDQRKAIEVKQKTESQKERKLTKDLNQVFGSAAGMNVLRWLMDQSGVHESPIVIDKATWEVKEKAMIYNAGRISMYLLIRKRLDPSITKPVENKGLAQDEAVDIFS